MLARMDSPLPDDRSAFPSREPRASKRLPKRAAECVVGFADVHGEGVYSTRGFAEGEVVMIGDIASEVAVNQPCASQIELNRFVLHAGLNRKVNHSCDPNCGIRVNSSGGHDFVARHRIVAGTEITFDYAMQNFVVEFFPDECQCGSVDCRGVITGWRDLPMERRVTYGQLVAPYLLALEGRR